MKDITRRQFIRTASGLLVPLAVPISKFDRAKAAILLGIQSGGLQPETIAYLKLPGVSLTDPQILSLDSNIKTIKYGAGISLTSVALQMSYPSGGPYFLSDIAYTATGLPSNDLRWLAGSWCKVNMYPTGGGPSASWTWAGSTASIAAETLSNELNGDVGFDSNIYWDKDVGWTITGSQAVVALGSGIGCSRPFILTNLALFKSVLTIATLSAGNISVLLGENFATSTLRYSASGVYTGYGTVPSAGNTTMYLWGTNSASGACNDWSVKQVLTPDTSSLTTLASKGGSAGMTVTGSPTVNPTTVDMKITAN